ncbi:MAG: hypothetical protein ACI4AK_01535 [Lepagella sp.]
MKKINYLLTIVMAYVMTSCRVNESTGEFETTWLFWALLIGFVVIMIITGIQSQKEAKKRGISQQELLEEKRKKLENQKRSEGVEVGYLGGYPEWSEPGNVNFRIKDSRIILRKGSERCEIDKEQIVAISTERSGQRSVGKTAAGAIVGGVLTGGIGLIVGGALGARKKDTSELFVTYNYNGVELTLHLKPGKNTDKVYAWINSVFA